MDKRSESPCMKLDSFTTYSGPHCLDKKRAILRYTRRGPRDHATYAGCQAEMLARLLLFARQGCGTSSAPGETEAGSAGTQPDQGIARPTVCRKAIVPRGWQPRPRGAFSPFGHRSYALKIQPGHCTGSLLHPQPAAHLLWPSRRATRSSLRGQSARAAWPAPCR